MHDLAISRTVQNRKHSWRWQVIAPATSNSKTGECYVIKRFLSENPGFLPGIRIFPEFFCTMLPRLISGFRKTKLYKNLLRIVGGDSKNTHTTSGIYILIFHTLWLFRALFCHTKFSFLHTLCSDFQVLVWQKSS